MATDVTRTDKPEDENYTAKAMREGVAAIDAEFGEGYARAHPELLAAFIQSEATQAAGFAVACEINDLAAAVLDLFSPGTSTH